MGKTLAASALALLLSGCFAPQRPSVWYKDGVTSSQFEADKYACLYAIEARGPGYPFGNLFDLCMRGKGYTQ